MLNTQNLFRVLFESKWKVFSIPVKEICVLPSLHRKLKRADYLDENDKPPLWYTTLPSSKKRARVLNQMKRKKIKPNLQTGEVIIDCKHKNLNHYRGTYYGKFDNVPLASKFWTSRKSRNNFFTILPTSEHPAFNFPKANTDEIPTTFKDAGVNDLIIDQLQKMDIKSPTVIQAKTIPQLLNGKHVLVAADTGSGKTLAYLIPVVQKILELKVKNNSTSNVNAPLGVVVVHTKELSVQTGMVAEKLCSDLGLRCGTLVGGKAESLVQNPVFEPVDLVVSSLGVFLKLLGNKIYTLENCKILVLDEADSLLDDSFRNYLQKLLSFSKMTFTSNLLNEVFTENQLCCVSATMPKSIESICDFLPVNLMEKITTNYLHKLQPHVPQLFIKVKTPTKVEMFLKYIKTYYNQKLPTIIFCNSTKCCNWLSYFLEDKNIKHARINGQMFANDRLSEYMKFRSGEVNVLCTTDVLSRGLDFPWVKRVINYEFPNYMADYIHRCGRTGRLGHTKNCKIINLVSRGNEAALVKKIEMAVRTQREIPSINNNIKKLIRERALRHSVENRLLKSLEIDESNKDLSKDTPPELQEITVKF